MQITTKPLTASRTLRLIAAFVVVVLFTWLADGVGTWQSLIGVAFAAGFAWLRTGTIGPLAAGAPSSWDITALRILGELERAGACKPSELAVSLAQETSIVDGWLKLLQANGYARLADEARWRLTSEGSALLALLSPQPPRPPLVAGGPHTPTTTPGRGALTALVVAVALSSGCATTLPAPAPIVRCEGGGECVAAADYHAARAVAVRCEGREWASGVGVFADIFTRLATRIGGAR